MLLVRGGRPSAGFTLIELMIVIAIIAILAAIALPAYSDYVKRGRIADAVGQVAGMQAKMEQFFQDRRTYVGACSSGTVAPLPATTTYFGFACANLSATTYQVVATGLNQMDGFSYTLNQDGARGSTVPTNWGGTCSTGWILSKGGPC